MIQVGPHRIGQTALAPMAAITNAPFRAICKAHGCGLTVTEMVSAEALVRNAKKTRVRMDRAAGEEILSVQLFGGTAAVMAEATRIAQDAGADIVDVNMGCPVRKISGGGAGVALMREPARAAAIVEAMVRVARVPVTVKLRAGWDDSSVNAPDVARAVEQAGAALIAVHGRTRDQVHAGEARWEVIGAVKQAVRVPVLGNGGVRTVEDALRMKRVSGCDGVMIARGAQGNPWIFRGIAAGKEEAPSASERFAVMRRHLCLYVEQVGEARAVIEIRKHLCWYVATLPGSAAFREELHAANDRDALEALIDRYEESVRRSFHSPQEESPCPTSAAA